MSLTRYLVEIYGADSFQMDKRTSVETLLVDLSSEDDARAEVALLLAFFILEQSSTFRAATTQHQASNDEWVTRLKSEYRKYNELGFLPDEYLGLILSSSETDRIVGALFDLTNREEPISNNAIAVIAVSSRLWAVERLADIVQDDASADSPKARDAVYAIGRILRENEVRPDLSLTKDQRRAFDVATRALHFAADIGADGELRAREQAIRELASLDRPQQRDL